MSFYGQALLKELSETGIPSYPPDTPTRIISIDPGSGEFDGNTHTIVFTDNFPTNGVTQYVAKIDGAIVSTQVAVAPATSIQLQDLPLDGGTYGVTIEAPSGSSDQFPASTPRTFKAKDTSSEELSLIFPPLSGYTAESDAVTFRWQDLSKPNAVYDLHIYSDAARTTKVVGTDGTIFDTSGIGTNTSHMFKLDPSDGGTRYGLLIQWPDASYNAEDKEEIEFEYTAHTSVAGEIESHRYEGPAHQLSALVNMPFDGAGTVNHRAKKQVSIHFYASIPQLETIQLYHNYRTGTSDYSAGDGGLVEHQLQAADASGLPDGVVLATTGTCVACPAAFSWNSSTAAATYPSANWPVGGTSQMPKYAFTTTPTLTQGKLYHIVCINKSSNTQTHHTSLNCCYHGPSPYTVNMKRGDAPQWLENDGVCWDLPADGGPWQPAQGKTFYAIHEVAGGGEVQGYTWYERGIPDDGDGSGDRAFSLSGARQLRIVWTPSEDTKIQKFALCAARRSGSGSISLAIKQGGSTLYSTTMSGFPSVGASNGSVTVIPFASRFVEIDIPKTFTCTGGSAVYFELSTDSSTNYKFVTNKDGAKAGIFTGGPNAGSLNTYTQQSTNSGSSWANMNNYSSPSDDMDIGHYIQLSPA